jgi:glutamate:GABA antiporter
MSKSSSTRKIGVLSLVMITVGSVDSIRNLPASAKLGSHLVFFYMLGMLLFFIPSAFVAAELSSSDSQRAGIFDWVKHAFGSLTGLLAVWFQWTENLFWYPLILSLIVESVLSYFAPHWVGNNLSERVIIAVSIIAIFWLITWVNLRGIKSSTTFATLCTLLGLILPFLFIMIMGFFWYYSSAPHHISLHWNNLIPRWNDPGWSSLTVIMLSLMGIEIATVHSSYVEKPGRVYPLALTISAVVLITTLIGGSLALALIIPANKADPFTSIVLFFRMVCEHYHMAFLVPYLVGSVVLGLIGSVNNWVIAPSSGLRHAARQGCLPPIFMKTNANDSPAFMLILQAGIVSLISFSFVFIHSPRMTFHLLTAIASQQYAFMYILMFAAVIKQRYQREKKAEEYRIPGGLPVVWICGLLGIISMVGVIIVGLIPTGKWSEKAFIEHEIFMIVGMLLFIAAAFWLYSRARLCEKKNDGSLD